MIPGQVFWSHCTRESTKCGCGRDDKHFNVRCVDVILMVKYVIGRRARQSFHITQPSLPELNITMNITHTKALILSMDPKHCKKYLKLSWKHLSKSSTKWLAEHLNRKVKSFVAEIWREDGKRWLLFYMVADTSA